VIQNAVVEAQTVGDGTVIEVQAKIGKGAVLGKVISAFPNLKCWSDTSKHCKIGPLCEIAEGEIVPDFTVVYGNGMRRLDSSGVEDLKLKMVARQIEVLKRLIPSNPAKFQWWSLVSKSLSILRSILLGPCCWSSWK
jgi:dynactin-6